MLARPEAIDRGTFLKRASALVAMAVIGRRPDLHHPEPRPGITAERVLSSEAAGSSKKDVLAAYDAARAYPQLFDGIACGCGCGGKSGDHRSLLVCYETKQPTGCASCQEEAKLVERLAKQNKTLEEIRAAVDKKFS
jgi:hypothetical protein